jgi:hypothetical protein
VDALAQRVLEGEGEKGNDLDLRCVLAEPDEGGIDPVRRSPGEQPDPESQCASPGSAALQPMAIRGSPPA